MHSYKQEKSQWPGKNYFAFSQTRWFTLQVISWNTDAQKTIYHTNIVLQVVVMTQNKQT